MFFLIVIGMIFFTEYYIKGHMDRVRTLQEQRPLAKGRIILKKYYNYGTAGSLFRAYPKAVRFVHASALTFVSGVLCYVLPQRKAVSVKTGLSFLAGGGLSNLYDRMQKGYVVDYVSFGFGPKRFQKLVFNLADFFVFAGIFLRLFSYFKKEGHA